jgi:hypothetical protein
MHLNMRRSFWPKNEDRLAPDGWNRCHPEPLATPVGAGWNRFQKSGGLYHQGK